MRDKRYICIYSIFDETCDMCIEIPTDFFENFTLFQINGYNNWKLLFLHIGILYINIYYLHISAIVPFKRSTLHCVKRDL